MAIARGSNGEDPSNSTSGRATPVTWSFNNVAGDYLLVSIQLYTNIDTVTGVTYNGVAMTQLGKRQSAAGNHSTIYLYGLAAPATGSQTVSISFTGSPTYVISMAFSYTGTHATQPDATAVNGEKATVNPTDLGLSQAITTVNDNAWTAWIVMTDTGVAVAAGTGSSLVRRDGFATTTQFFDSNAVITPAQANTMQATAGATDVVTWVMTSIRVAGAGGGGGVTYPELERVTRGLDRGIAH